MKTVTLYALIGFTLMLLINIYYLVANIGGIFDRINLLWIIPRFIQIVAIALITYFFFALHKKQNKRKKQLSWAYLEPFYGFFPFSSVKAVISMRYIYGATGYQIPHIIFSK